MTLFSRSVQTYAYTQRRSLAGLLILLGSLIIFSPASAQTFTTIHHFSIASGPFPATNSDGAHSESPVVVSNGVIFGNTFSGGQFGNGTVFRLNTDGSAFTNLHDFTATDNPGSTNLDGADPVAGLVLHDDTLFGSANYGGTSGNGALFSVKTDGTEFTNLHNFSATTNFTDPTPDGAGQSGVTLSGALAYGTAYRGGDGGAGTIFLMGKSGSGFIPLFSFDSAANGSNASGAGPSTPILLSDGVLYGTTDHGGAANNGVVFRINTDGSGFTNLHNFSARAGDTNEDGADPQSGLVLAGDRLYGTAILGGDAGNGVVFSVNTDGSGFQTLHSFSPGFGTFETNYDGINPAAGLVLVGDVLYGATPSGGFYGNGVLYGLRTNGSGFFILHHFSADTGPASTNFDGALPYGELVVDGPYLYGTAEYGGAFGMGTVFKISIPALLTIEREDSDVIVSWPTNVTGYTLETATNLADASWTALSSASISRTWNVVTNHPTEPNRFFRLRKP
jgi:uncharacterized repeat protein (TIGR03803 family)